MLNSDYNMTLELSNVLLSFSGALISGLMVVVVYGLRSFAQNVKELKNTVAEMNILISVVQERISNIRTDIDKVDGGIEKQIKSINEDLTDLYCQTSALRQDIEVLKAMEKEHHSKKNKD